MGLAFRKNFAGVLYSGEATVYTPGRSSEASWDIVAERRIVEKGKPVVRRGRKAKQAHPSVNPAEDGRLGCQ